jgi:hypothetical protein
VLVSYAQGLCSVPSIAKREKEKRKKDYALLDYFVANSEE